MLPAFAKDLVQRYLGPYEEPHMSLGFIQVILGIFSVLTNITALFVSASLSYVSIGIWGGVIMMVAGSFGVLISLGNNKCAAITTMVMSIVAAVTGAALLVLSTIGLALDVNADGSPTAVINGSMLLLGLVEMIIAIIQSAYSCQAMGPDDGATQQVGSTPYGGASQKKQS